MPYIRKVRRDLYDHEMDGLCRLLAHAPAGELNYVLTRQVLAFMGREFMATPITYDRANAVYGVLELMQLELYWRLIRRFERRKRIENGDLLGFVRQD